MRARIDITGRVALNPEVKQLGEKVVTEVTLVVNKGRDVPGTFYKAAFWDKKAASAHEYINKGDMLRVWGDLEARSYVKKDGTAATSLEVKGADFDLIASRKQEAPAQQAAADEEDINW